MEALQLLVFVGVWLLFLVFVGYGFGIAGCRRSAWWAPGQKIRGYVTVPSPRLARLLVARYGGYNPRIRTNIGALYSRFRLNRYPDRASYLGVFDWCVTLPLAGWWAWEVTRYFWIAPLLELEIGNGLPAAGLTLCLFHLAMGWVGVWNDSGADLGPALTKEELRAALEKEDTP